MLEALGAPFTTPHEALLSRHRAELNAANRNAWLELATNNSVAVCNAIATLSGSLAPSEQERFVTVLLTRFELACAPGTRLQSPTACWGLAAERASCAFVALSAEGDGFGRRAVGALLSHARSDLRGAPLRALAARRQSAAQCRALMDAHGDALMAVSLTDESAKLRRVALEALRRLGRHGGGGPLVETLLRQLAQDDSMDVVGDAIAALHETLGPGEEARFVTAVLTRLSAVTFHSGRRAASLGAMRVAALSAGAFVALSAARHDAGRRGVRALLEHKHPELRAAALRALAASARGGANSARGGVGAAARRSDLADAHGDAVVARLGAAESCKVRPAALEALLALKDDPWLARHSALVEDVSLLALFASFPDWGPFERLPVEVDRFSSMARPWEEARRQNERDASAREAEQFLRDAHASSPPFRAAWDRAAERQRDATRRREAAARREEAARAALLQPPAAAGGASSSSATASDGAAASDSRRAEHTLQRRPDKPHPTDPTKASNGVLYKDVIY